jgi:hypothetical protein
MIDNPSVGSGVIRWQSGEVAIDSWIIIVAPIGIIYGLTTTEKKSQVVAITGGQAASCQGQHNICF